MNFEPIKIKIKKILKKSKKIRIEKNKMCFKKNFTGKCPHLQMSQTANVPTGKRSNRQMSSPANVH